MLIAAFAPRTAALLEDLGFTPIVVDISEFEKLEGCVTRRACCCGPVVFAGPAVLLPPSRDRECAQDVRAQGLLGRVDDLQIGPPCRSAAVMSNGSTGAAGPPWPRSGPGLAPAGGPAAAETRVSVAGSPAGAAAITLRKKSSRYPRVRALGGLSHR